MENKYTPAPWTACFGTFNGHVTHFHITCDKDGSTKPIVKCDNDFTGGLGKWTASELKANAQLIAASPILYEYALEQAKNGCEKARAAIKKARGE